MNAATATGVGQRVAGQGGEAGAALRGQRGLTVGLTEGDLVGMSCAGGSVKAGNIVSQERRGMREKHLTFLGYNCRRVRRSSPWGWWWETW